MVYLVLLLVLHLDWVKKMIDPDLELLLKIPKEIEFLESQLGVACNFGRDNHNPKYIELKSKIVDLEKESQSIKSKLEEKLEKAETSMTYYVKTTRGGKLIPKFLNSFRRFIQGIGVEREFEDAEQYLHINRGNGNRFNKITIETNEGNLIYERKGIDWFCRYEKSQEKIK